jgi:hypothetical protein
MTSSWDIPQWIFQNHCKTSGPKKRQQSIAWDLNYTWFLWFEVLSLVFKTARNMFLKLFSTSGLSQICKILKVWNLPSSKKSLIELPDEFKMNLKNFLYCENLCTVATVKISKPVLRHLCRKSQNHTFYDHFRSYWTILLLKWCFLPPTSLFSVWERSNPWVGAWSFHVFLIL